MDEPRTVRLASVTSTQDVARELPIGSVVVADHQTVGRGRLDRRWEAPPGTALLASFVVAPGPLLSLAAGVAAAEACGPDVRLKWPNDLLLRDRKLGGILVEVAGGKAIVGVGINLFAAPAGAAQLGLPPEEVLTRLQSRLTRWNTASAEEIRKRWRQLADTIGKRVRVELPGRTIDGIADGINDDGALIVNGEAVSAGDVIHVRPPLRAARARAVPRPLDRE